MKLLLKRLPAGPTATLGSLFDISSLRARFLCFTCEDEPREVKVAGETRIPGNGATYRLALRKLGDSRFDARYTERFGADFHKGMIHVMDVPGFDWVLIHCGNNEKDTDGCILVGLTATYEAGGGVISQSAEAYKVVYPLVRDALLRGEEVTLTILD